MPSDAFCIVIIPNEKMSYGIMEEELHSKFMDVLSGETLECLEYLDENDFKKLGEVDRSEIIGNASLLDKLSF